MLVLLKAVKYDGWTVSESSPEQEPFIRWRDMPEFHDTYMPWCDRVIESEPVRGLVNTVRTDIATIEANGTAFMPNIHYLTTGIRQIELQGEEVHYEAAYYKGDGDDEDEHITISLGNHYSIVLFPSRTGDETYKIGLSAKIVNAPHVLLGSGHSYSPFPFINDAHQRDYAEVLIAKVAKDVCPPTQPSSVG